MRLQQLQGIDVNQFVVFWARENPLAPPSHSPREKSGATVLPKPGERVSLILLYVHEALMQSFDGLRSPRFYTHYEHLKLLFFQIQNLRTVLFVEKIFKMCGVYTIIIKSTRFAS